MATEGCQFGQEITYLNVTRVSLAQLPGGDVETVCLWLFCPFTSMPHALQTIADSSTSLCAVTAKVGCQEWKAPYVRIFFKETYTQHILNTLEHNRGLHSLTERCKIGTE